MDSFKKLALVMVIGMFLSTYSLVSNATCTSTTDYWACSNEQCNIEWVRYFPGSSRYLQIRLETPTDNCEYIQFKVANDTCDGGSYSVDDLRALESVALTGMTTGLPLAFYITERDGSVCFASTVIMRQTSAATW